MKSPLPHSYAQVVSAAFTDDGVVRLLKRKMLSCKKQCESAAGKGPSRTIEGAARGNTVAAAPEFECGGENKQAIICLEAESNEAHEMCGLMQPDQSLGSCPVGGRKARQQERADSEQTTVVGGDAAPRMVLTSSAIDFPPLLLQQMESRNPPQCNMEGGGWSSLNGLPLASPQKETQRLPGSVDSLGWRASSLEGEGEVNEDCTVEADVEREVAAGQGPTHQLAGERDLSDGLKAYGCVNDDRSWSRSTLTLGTDADLVAVENDDQQCCFSTGANRSPRGGLASARSSNIVTNASAVVSASVTEKEAVPTPSLDLPELCLVSPSLIGNCSIKHGFEAPADAKGAVVPGLPGALHNQQTMACEASADVVEEMVQTGEEAREFEGNRVIESGRRVMMTATPEGTEVGNRQALDGDNAQFITAPRGVADSATVNLGEEVEEAAGTGEGGLEVIPATNTTAAECEKQDAAGVEEGATENTIGLNGCITVVPRIASTVFESLPAQETINSATGGDDEVLPQVIALVGQDPVTYGEGLDRVDTEDEEEDYTCDVFEPATSISDQKKVHFSDKASWIVHEVRASFERHELTELFYSSAELDRMLEEVEQEESDHQSGAQRLTNGGRGGGVNVHGRVSECEDAGALPVEGSYFDLLQECSQKDDISLESYSLDAAEDSDDVF